MTAPVSTAPAVDPVLALALEARFECGATVFALHGYRVWQLTDDATRCAITFGGSEVEAHAAVVAMLHERQCGDYTFEVRLLTSPPQAEPCGWCERNKRYAH